MSGDYSAAAHRGRHGAHARGLADDDDDDDDYCYCY